MESIIRNRRRADEVKCMQHDKDAAISHKVRYEGCEDTKGANILQLVEDH